MKKFIGILQAVLLGLILPLTVAATELTSCTVSVDSAAAAPGETVTVAVRMTDNPGFTNFAIGLDYDREILNLKSIDISDGETPYLCGTQVSTNTEWADESGESLAYLVSAAAEAVKEEGILFTATFEVSADFVGETEIAPKVQYVRNNEAVFSIFEPLHVNVSAGTVTSILLGDVNGDGIVEYDDVMLAYKAYLGEAELTPEELAVVDRNGNGTIEEEEYQMIYQIYIGG